MFFEEQNLKEKEDYKNFLKLIWSLSNLFSDSEIPYLYYRIAEKIFCRAFNADDLSRSDVSVDARKNKLWIWLKTFLAWNNKTFQKVAEFNADKSLYENLSLEKKIKKIAELRNQRIDFTHRIHSLDYSIYHCIIRDINKFLIHEERLEKIFIEGIKDIKKTKSSITFNDWKNEYSFLTSKSTLTKRFKITSNLYSFNVEIIKDPLVELNNFFWRIEKAELFSSLKIKQTVYLPLYWKWKKVYEKSWLNQWNASGRKRNPNEIYIPIPIKIHKKFFDFFPKRDKQFTLKLPNWANLLVKICQDKWKALMSNPNKALWQWLLRDVLKLNERELLTYERLQILWIDSVRIDKVDEENFEINFVKKWSYEEFKLNNIW